MFSVFIYYIQIGVQHLTFLGLICFYVVFSSHIFVKKKRKEKKEEFEDTKEVIKSCTSKDRQYN